MEHGFAPELVARWGAFYPNLRRLVEALQKKSPTYFRANGLRAEPGHTVESLRSKGFELADAGLPGAYRVDKAPISSGATQEYLQGQYFLQDLSSQLAPMAIEAQPGETIADLAAAPGGKTIAMADAMRNQGSICAYDPDRSRHRALVANLARCGVYNTATWEAVGQTAGAFPETFDAVLLDAPCTGEGVIQRDPSRRQGQLQEYESCANEQWDLLRTAHRILKPGGRLVYATCTLAPEENEFQVDRAVRELGFTIRPLPKSLRDLRLMGEPLMPGLSKVMDQTMTSGIELTAHALPHLHGCLGFYVARLEKGAS